MGQNFLHEPNVARRIVELAAIRPGEHCLEIGPGAGALTAELLGHPAAPAVVAVEIDPRLCEELARSFGDHPRFRLRRGDILRQDPVELLPPDHPWVVVTNAPYSISGALLRWLMRASSRFDRALVMLQEEVVERMTAHPGSRRYGILSAAIAYHFAVEKLMQVSANAFRPRPRVSSAVVRLRPHPEPPVRVDDPDLLFRVMRAAFSQRRKTIRNSLRASALELPGGESGIDLALQSAGVAPETRPEQLDLESFARIANAFPPS